jgi:hypothetical protein
MHKLEWLIGHWQGHLLLLRNQDGDIVIGLA